jgi:hypothetical protein
MQFTITRGSRSSQLLIAMGLVGVLGFMAPWAEHGLAAQESDHLTCFRVKDAAKVDSEATANLFFPGLQPPIGANGCEVRVLALIASPLVLWAARTRSCSAPRRLRSFRHADLKIRLFAAALRDA